ncbi:Estrogen receptor [Mactra antiquata]
MPPPKKPKVGRTSLEQFLSEDERVNVLHFGREEHSSDGNSPTASVEDGSDGEVFVKSEDSTLNGTLKLSSSDGHQETLFQKLFRKSQSIDEQKVPGSPEQDTPSPTSSPSADGDKIGAFKSYQEHIRLQLEQRQEMAVKAECVSPRQDKLEQFRQANGNAFEASSFPGSKISQEQGRLIETLVASALASSAAQSIIYGGRPSHGSVTAIASLTRGQNTALNGCNERSYDTEPHDLSKKQDNGKFLSHRMYENFSNVTDKDRLQNVYREWALKHNKDYTFERSKHYLEARSRIVGLLSERSTEGQVDERSARILEKENIVHPVPTRYSNGFFSHVGVNGMLNGYQRFEQSPHQRDPVDRQTAKTDDTTCMISGGNYMPVQSMMPPASVNQSPTSTTLDHNDHRDRYHPALMSPHFLTDSRRMKSEPSHGSNVNKLCQVCSDNASGFHYGVWSCEGCKAFFKRSIQGPVDYVCPATNTCTIDKHRRKSCQACRLRKCYEVGMNKGSQRKERKSSGAASQSNRSPKRPRSDSGDLINGVDSSPTPAKNSRKSRTTLIIEALSKADLPNLESYHNHSLPPTREHLLASFVKLAEKELVFLINWAKNVPGYTELSLGDQVHLIECCWMELLLLNCAFRSMEHAGRRLVIAPDLVLDRQYWSNLGMGDVLEQVAAVSDQLVQYNLHKEELLLLQATVLANAEVRKLASFNKLHEIRQNILDSIIDIAQKYHPDNLKHVPSLLLLLTHIRQAAERATSYFQSVKSEGVITFCDLLSEMLDAQSDMKKTQVSSDVS